MPGILVSVSDKVSHVNIKIYRTGITTAIFASVKLANNGIYMLRLLLPFEIDTRATS